MMIIPKGMEDIPKLRQAYDHINNINEVDRLEAFYIARAYSLVMVALIADRADDIEDLKKGIELLSGPLMSFCALCFKEKHKQDTQ